MFHLTQSRVELIIGDTAHSSLDSSIAKWVAVSEERREVVWIDGDN